MSCPDDGATSSITTTNVIARVCVGLQDPSKNCSTRDALMKDTPLIETYTCAQITTNPDGGQAPDYPLTSH